MPVARHRERAPAMLRPWVVVLERYSGMADLGAIGLKLRWSGKMRRQRKHV
jgi:hypothetical protein